MSDSTSCAFMAPNVPRSDGNYGVPDIEDTLKNPPVDVSGSLNQNGYHIWWEQDDDGYCYAYYDFDEDEHDADAEQLIYPYTIVVTTETRQDECLRGIQQSFTFYFTPTRPRVDYYTGLHIDGTLHVGDSGSHFYAPDYPSSYAIVDVFNGALPGCRMYMMVRQRKVMSPAQQTGPEYTAYMPPGIL